ncbi:helix-turn-helix domain-containing protein [Streptomyces mirabilis]|uniref:helix-turn-helix domain-containing protein n=1 Tax=Streptomyces mirabilis TaxID=68239 RepID=UPI0034085BF7
MTTAVRKRPNRPTRGARSPLPPHGTAARGVGRPGQGIPGCKCQPCRNAKVKADALRALANSSGRPVRVPAAPAAAHIRTLLDAGMGWTRIGHAAHSSSCTIARILNGQELIRRTVAERLLAVKYRPAPGRIVDATGTRRRIQALIAVGYTIEGIAAESDVDHSAINNILNGSMNVRGITFDRIAAAYDWFSQREPDVRPSAATTSRKRAAREGWRDPQWWEDYGRIDDPEFDPDKADAELNFHERAKLRREEIIHLAWVGHQPEQILDRLDNEVSIATVRSVVQEWRTGQKRQRKQVAA